MDNPALLCKRVLELARSEVCASGYVFKKGKYRGNTVTSKETSVKVSRSKVSAELRRKQITSLKSPTLMNRYPSRQQAESVRNYKKCEEITEEMGIVKQQRRELKGESKFSKRRRGKQVGMHKRRRERQHPAGNLQMAVLPLSSRSSSDSLD